MAFPTVTSITETILDNNATPHLVAMPATVVVNDLLLMFFTNDHAPAQTVTTPTGWTLISGVDAFEERARLNIFGKKAAGTEGGATVDVVTSGAQMATAQVYRILAAEWSQVLAEIEVGVGAQAQSTSPNSPALTPVGGAKDYLWIAATGCDTNTTVSVYPTNYTNGTDTVNGGGTPTEGATTGTARRELNATTDNPGVFTTASVRWAAQTLVIPPAVVVGGSGGRNLLLLGVG